MTTKTSSISSLSNRQILINHTPQGECLRRFKESTAFVHGLIGPLGSAKTTDACVKILKLINDQPPDYEGKRRSRWLVMRNTLVDLKSTTIKDWRSIAGDELGPFTYSAPITHQLSWLHEDGYTVIQAEVLFVGFDDLGDVRKLRGFQLTGLWIDEAKEMAKEIVDMAIGRLKRYPKRREISGGYPSHALLTSNAPAGDEWLAEAARNPPHGWEIFVQPGGVIKVNGKWEVNPNAENLHNLDPTYYFAQLAGKKESWIRANLANEFVYSGTGNPVHPDFNERVHVADHHLQPHPSMPLVMGFDWGRTPACIILQEQPNGQLFFLREITTNNTSIPPFAKKVRKFINKHYEGMEFDDSWGDPSGDRGGERSDETVFDQCNAVGVELNVYPAPCPDNNFDVRTAALDIPLTEMVDGEPRVAIDPRCTMFIRGLGGAYHFRRVAVAGYESMYHDKPAKTPESHVCEAAHYVLLGIGEGDTVTTEAVSEVDFKAIEQEYGGWHPDQSKFE